MSLNFARRCVVALSLAFALALPSAALAGRQVGSNKVDGRGARAAVMKNRAQRGLSTNVSVTKIKDSRSGKSAQVLSTVRGSGKVEAYNVNKSTGVARRTPTGMLTQGDAAMRASGQMHRERNPGKGRFSGLNKQGVSTGKTYRFASATDKTEKVFVSPTTGKVTATRK